MENSSDKLPKILICCPTSKHKNYCFDAWLDNILSLNYCGEWNVRVFDNSRDNLLNVSWMNRKFLDRYGKNNHRFKALFVPTYSSSTIERMKDSMEELRAYAIIKNYDKILHVESDVFPPHDVIQELLFHNKKVVGAIYDRDEGIYRKLTVQHIIKEAPDKINSVNFVSGEEIGFCDGTLKKVSSIGLGCVMININVLKKFPFRWEPNNQLHPDALWSYDCFKNGIDIWADTAQFCRHENKDYWFDNARKEKLLK